MSITTESNTSVTMTEAAIKHVKAQLAKRGRGIGLRVGVKKTGCSGLAYVVDYVDEANADDQVYSLEDGLAVYVDPDSLPHVMGTRVDFVRQGLTSGFEFNNPNARETCGCGESFTV